MEKLDINYLQGDTRARVYLLWAILTTLGFSTTHYYQDKNINFVWFVVGVIGLGYMYRVMPLRVTQMRRIFLAWLVPISFGLAVSIVSARGWLWPELVGYLGVFWLLVMSAGYFANGLIDAPMKWYMLAVAMNVGAAALIYFSDVFLIGQYLVAAVISAWSMLNLLIFRTD